LHPLRLGCFVGISERMPKPPLPPDLKHCSDCGKVADTPYLTFAERQVVLRETETKQLLEAHEALIGAHDA
jgi:hypothetical protein